MTSESWVEPGSLKLGPYLIDIWLPQLLDQEEDSTWESYERNVRVHVIPHLSGVRLQQLQPAQLNGLYRKLVSGIEREVPANAVMLPTSTSESWSSAVRA